MSGGGDRADGELLANGPRPRGPDGRVATATFVDRERAFTASSVDFRDGTVGDGLSFSS
jgi:hypothetical protein